MCVFFLGLKALIYLPVKPGARTFIFNYPHSHHFLVSTNYSQLMYALA